MCLGFTPQQPPRDTGLSGTKQMKNDKSTKRHKNTGVNAQGYKDVPFVSLAGLYEK